MAKKRKATPKSTEASTATQTQRKKVQKKNQPQDDEEQEDQSKQQQQLEAEQQQQQQPEEEVEEKAEDEEEEEVEEEFVEYEEEEEEEEEFEEDLDDEDDNDEETKQKDEETKQNDDETKKNDVVVEDNDDDDEPIANLLEPFTKDQLVMILREAAETHPDVADRVRKVADEDTVHRKIFVHGLGWETDTDTLKAAFLEFGEIEDCKAVTDKLSGKSKGYGFILFKTRAGARKALKEPQKKIGDRMTACQLAAVGPGPAPGVGSGPGLGSVGGSGVKGVVSEYTQRKIYVSNVASDIDPQKLMEFFSKFGEIEEGPLGLDKKTGKPKGFCLFVYRSIESAKKALEEPHKQFEGHMLHCQKAVDGPKQGKYQMGPPRGKHFGGRGKSHNMAGGVPATGPGYMGQSVGGVGYNQGAAAPGLSPALGQALTALLASQGGGLGNLLGALGGGASAAHGAYGAQSVGVNPLGGLQSAYPNQQLGQGGAGMSQHGHRGGGPPYGGR